MDKRLFLILCALGAAGWVVPTAVRAQNTGAQPPATSQGMIGSAPTAAEKAMMAPTESDIYCAGFFTHRTISPEIIVLGGQDNGLKFEFGAGEVVHLNQGKNKISAPGGQYMLVRPTRDMNPTEAFPGQSVLVKQMGTHYAEIARIQVQVVNADSSIAEILNACEPVLSGDVAIPLPARSAPPYKTAPPMDRFAPSSGKSTGVIASIKEFREAAGEGDTVYLNTGSKQGAQPGAYLRVFRTYNTASQRIIQMGTKQYLNQVEGTQVGRKLTPEEINTLPRQVVGEVMILSVEEESAAGIVTYSWQDLYPGDQVEVE